MLRGMFTLTFLKVGNRYDGKSQVTKSYRYSLYFLLLVLGLSSPGCGRMWGSLSRNSRLPSVSSTPLVSAFRSVDGNGTNGINKDPTKNGTNVQFAVFNSKLYLAWSETRVTNEIRVAVYNGNDSSPAWPFV